LPQDQARLCRGILQYGPCAKGKGRSRRRNTKLLQRPRD